MRVNGGSNFDSLKVVRVNGGSNYNSLIVMYMSKYDSYSNAGVGGSNYDSLIVVRASGGSNLDSLKVNLRPYLWSIFLNLVNFRFNFSYLKKFLTGQIMVRTGPV